MSNITPQQHLKKTIENMKPEFGRALMDHIDPDKFTRAAQTAVLNDPYLVKADKASLFNSLMKCASTGLMPDNVESSLVCYGPKVTFIPMYQGLIKLIGPSLKTMQTNIVREGDEFVYYVDADGEHLTYKPGGNGFGTNGDIQGAYCRLELKDGSVWIERMSLDDLQAIEKSSKAKNGPWKGPFKEEMMKKSVFKRLFKRLPKGVVESDTAMEAVAKAVEKDEEIEFPKERDITPKETREPSKVPSKLKAEMGIKDVNEEQPPMPESEDAPLKDEEMPI